MAELALVPQSSSIAMVEKNRLDTLAGYNAKEHLVKWIANQNGKSAVVEYYPAAWRLYELSLRYGDANFANDIIHMDVEKNIVVIRSRLYLGADYAASPKKSEAHKYGKLTELDKVETKAMARAARNFGIGTEHALDFDDVEPDPHATVVNADPGTQSGNAPANQQNGAKRTVDAPPVVQSQHPPLVQAMLDARSAGMITGTTKEDRTASWEEQVIMIFGKLISAEEQAKPENIAKINAAITRHKSIAANGK